MFLKRLMIPVGIFAFVFLTHAQQASTTALKNPQAVSILTQSLNAAGGLSAISGIQDYTGMGTITYNWPGEQASVPVTVRGMGIGNFRIDASLPGGARTWAASNYSGVLITPDGTRQSGFGSSLFTAGSLTLPYIRIASVLTDTTTSVSLVGTVSINGQQAYQIHLVPALDPSMTANSPSQELGAFELYIDPSSFLVTELVETANPSSRTTFLHEIDFSNYQAAGNIHAPFTISEKVNGQQTWSIVLNSLAFNSGLTIAEFNP
jgi:hypothetical protein